MSDFSSTVKCGKCGERFAPDDSPGGCPNCEDEEESEPTVTCPYGHTVGVDYGMEGNDCVECEAWRREECRMA